MLRALVLQEEATLLHAEFLQISRITSSHQLIREGRENRLYGPSSPDVWTKGILG